MTKIMVDGVERAGDPAFAQWSDVLDVMDQDLARTGRIVTGVQMDGIDQAAFRDGSLAARPLTGVAVVHVQSGTEADVVERCLTDVAMAVDALRTEAATVGGAFRRHDLTVALAGLRELAGGLGTLMALVQAIGLALRVDLAGGSPRAASIAELVTELSSHIEAVIAAQQNQDWLTVADVIEYDIEPSLGRWQDVLASLNVSEAPVLLRAAS